MKRKSHATSPCSLARSLDILGDWWTPLILREALYGVHRFDELQRWLGIGRNILARRLEQLVEQGLLERRPYQERPLREGYHLTDKGYDAAGALLALMPFGERWLCESGEPPICLYDARTGRRVRVAVCDAETGEALDPRELIAGPGPSFPSDAELRRERFAAYFARFEAPPSAEGAEP